MGEFLADSRSMRAEPPAVAEVSAPLASEPMPPVGLPDGEGTYPGRRAGRRVERGVSTRRNHLPTRAERMGSAIRLTREAVQAWSELMHESPEQADSSR